MRRLFAGLLTAITLVASLSACAGGSEMTITAEFKDTAGLFVGNDVGVLGVRVGQVTSLKPAGDRVLVTLTVDPDVKIPGDAKAVVVSRSVATDRYVELTPAYTKGATLASGSTIGLDKTRIPVEFDEVLESLNKLTKAAAGPDGKAGPLGEVLDASAKTLDGNGTLMAQTIADLGKALKAVNGGSDDVSSIIDNLDTLSAALADNDQTVRKFSTNMTEATSMFAEEHDNMERTFNALSVMLAKVAAFAREHHQAIGSQIKEITSISSSLVEHQDDLEEALEVMPLMMQNVQRAVDDDGRLVYKLRPGDLVPGRVAADTLCHTVEENDANPLGPFCDKVDLDSVGLFDLLEKLGGIQ